MLTTGLLLLGALILVIFARYFTVKVGPKGAVPKEHVDADSSHHFHTKIVGVTFSNSDGTKRQDIIKRSCHPGLILQLTPEPNNPKDKNAVAVQTPAGQIGYLQGGRIAEDVQRHILRGGGIVAKIKNITGGDKSKPTLGVNIEIELTD